MLPFPFLTPPFPCLQYLMKKNTYRYLSNLVDLHYYPIYSWSLLPINMTQYYGVELMNEVRLVWEMDCCAAERCAPML
jgi:hypothetical protein